MGYDWLPARGYRCGVASIERVWLSYSVSDQNRAWGMSGGSVTVYDVAPSKKAFFESMKATRYWLPIPVRRMAIAGVIPV